MPRGRKKGTQKFEKRKQAQSYKNVSIRFKEDEYKELYSKILEKHKDEYSSLSDYIKSVINKDMQENKQLSEADDFVIKFKEEELNLLESAITDHAQVLEMSGDVVESEQAWRLECLIYDIRKLDYRKEWLNHNEYIKNLLGKTKRTRIDVYLTPTQFVKLKKAANEKGESVSSLARTSIEEKLKDCK